MQLLKSLFCFKGLDNSERFFAISICCLAVFLLFIGVILSSLIAQVVLLALISIVYFTASIRRCRDSRKGSAVAWLISVVTSLSFLAIILLPDASGYALLILPIIGSLYLFSIPSAKPHVYVMGYYGPVDLSALSEPVKVERKPISNRIEPSLFGQSSDEQEDEYSFHPPGQNEPATDADNSSTNPEPQPKYASNDSAELIHNWLTKNKALAAIASLVFMVLSVSFVSLPYIVNEPAEALNAGGTADTVALNKVVRQRSNLLAMPDEFYLLLDQHDGLILHWQADQINNGEIWSQLTGQGDDSCEVIEFNNGDKVRTINVEVEDSGDYYANFSPLDTALVVRSLARRGNFGLCGYNFSLKGSQKALNSNPVYSDYAN
ncbi:hypothetical protein [Thalassotalea sp. ND16A]|uniref:hypothetical protein n=1 Tax=Thalassotalea sp. ND16A TaxID=1535422 RepID=UPI00051A034F|nr:hypothetical protein [Thalassotalea sp. ND16A]KGJ91031.1 hypothetical protein ND16A_1824 [Thalassotalea sp. ND16A]